MLKLRLGAASDEWVDLFDGLSVKFKPYSTSVEMIARGASLGSLEDLLERQETKAKLSPEDLAAQGYRFLTELAVRTIEDWQGVGSDLDQEPLPCTEENIRLAMEQSQDFYAGFEREWSLRAKAREQEKKVFVNGPNGIAAKVPGTVTTAESAESPVPQTATEQLDFAHIEPTFQVVN